MNCNCPFADQCLHSEKPTPAWLQLLRTAIVVGAFVASWQVVFLLGRVVWGWL